MCAAPFLPHFARLQGKQTPHISNWYLKLVILLGLPVTFSPVYIMATEQMNSDAQAAAGPPQGRKRKYFVPIGTSLPDIRQLQRHGVLIKQQKTTRMS